MPAQKLADKHSLKTLSGMEPANGGGLPQNNSHQYLMQECCEGAAPDSQETGGPRDPIVPQRITLKQWATVIILFYVNLINYMDRYTIAGVLSEIKSHFGIGDDLGGLLQTVFVISYMLFAPLFGYLGDRYNRRIIMAFGVFLWCLTTLVGSFMEDFGWFLTFRTFVGIGEASYSTVAPTIISDLFVADVRSKMLALFYFAIPVGSGLGYIIGSETANATSQWQWGLRVTPILGAIAVVLILFAMIDPERGQSEGRSHVGRSTSWLSDIVTLCKNKSFVLSTLGFTCVAFVAGALAWWGPRFIYLGRILQDGHDDADQADVSYKFGVITMISGLVGVPLGSMLAQRLRPRMPRVDPIICAIGLIVSAPVLFTASLLAGTNSVACYCFVFVGEVALNLNWSIVADILLYVVIPNRRSSAEALQILISHALGDAGSPYLVGLISELLKPGLSVGVAVATMTASMSGTTAPTISPSAEFYSLQYALFTTCFVEVLGGFFFLLTALYIVNDKAEAERQIGGVDNAGIPTHLCADDPLSRSEVNLTVA